MASLKAQRWQEARLESQARGNHPIEAQRRPVGHPQEYAVERVTAAARQRARAEIGRIVEAAWDVLAETGWEDLRVGMVLDHANVSTRNFYRNFSSKSELLLALFEEEIGRFATQLGEAMHRCDGPVEQVTTWISLNLKRAYNP